MSRLPDAGPPVVVLVRQGCHLCDQFIAELEIDLGPAALALRIVDVDTDVDLATRFGLRVPVLQVGGHVVCEGVYDAPRTREALGL